MNQARLVALLLLSLSPPAGLTAAQATPRYTNAELVSINAQTRLVVVKNTDGREQTLKLDDTVAGLESFRAGDRVMLTVRQDPGMDRISSIARSQASPPSARPTVTLVPAVGNTALDPALKSFGEQVAALSRQAGQIDSLWTNFKTACNVTLRSSYTDGRDWFSLWDGSAQIDVSGGSCRDLFNQIVGEGEAVKAGMAGAEEAARKAEVSPGDLREVLRRHSMEWGGWALPAPEPLKQ